MGFVVKQELSEVRTIFIQELGAAISSRQVEDVRVKTLGRKGPVQALMQHLKKLDLEGKKA
ncbi:hypothetical protein COB21_06215, partial [Candidatus Aerophobetes bacterium]